jgi:UPF0176 protein
MPLYNTLSAIQRAELIDAAGKDRITISFYKYHGIENPSQLRDDLFIAWDKLDVLGRIYVADEGINAQLSVPADRFHEFKGHLDSYPFLKGIRLNIAVEQDNKSFLKLTVKVRRKIVADGIVDPTFDAANTGVHLKAKDFNEIIAHPDTILVDMRNHFESEIGHFQGAIKPDVDTFRESLDIIEAEIGKHREDKPLVMYCTGGIRCEKASAYFKHKGFKSVFQLEGGIIEYLRQVKADSLENHFKGKNFVFDERLAERISDDIVSNCHLCGVPADTHQNCENEACHMLFIQCEACATKFNRCCSEKCQAVRALPDETRKAMRKGYRAPKKYFRRRKL